jgi:hypothetical protein
MSARAGDLRSKMTALLSQHDALADDPEALDQRLRDYMGRTGVTSYSQAFAEFSAFNRELRNICRMFEREDVDQAEVEKVTEAFARSEDHGATVCFTTALREADRG